MYHTLAWAESIAEDVENDLAPVNDDMVTQSNSHFLLPKDMNLYGAIAMGASIERARLSSPKYANIGGISLRPVQPTLAGANDANFSWHDRVPIPFRGQEELIAYSFHSGAAAEVETVVAFLGGTLTPVPRTQVWPVRATSTTAAVANTWTTISYTLGTALPAGRYALGLVEHSSTTAKAVRVIFDEGGYRPGAPSAASISQRINDAWYQYPLGVWGYFETYALPRVQVLCNTTDAAHDLVLHVFPMAGQF
jgi:hypothetical protein